MDVSLPQCVEDITPSWLDQVLRAADLLGTQRVVAARHTIIGAERGFLSQTIRVALDYDGSAGPAPRSLVVKIEPAAGTFRTAERGLKAFAREIRFYRDLAAPLSLRVPRIFYAATSEAGSALVMEDLSACVSVDQIDGLHQAQVIDTVAEIAKLHAAYWHRIGDPTLAWIPDHDHFFAEGYEVAWPDFARTYERRLGAAAVRLGERMARHRVALEERIAARPATVIHGDLRADNLLFAPDGVVILDWQLITRSLAAIDVARLLGGSERAAERCGHQVEVFTAWHAALQRGGVGNYESSEAFTDFRLAVLYCLFVPVKGFHLVGPNPGGRTQRLLDAMVERFFASALELDAGALLP